MQDPMEVYNYLKDYACLTTCKSVFPDERYAKNLEETKSTTL